jgi:hypothetical protein
LETETCVACTRAISKALLDVSVDFETKITVASADKEVLYAKYQKIQDFKRLTVRIVCLLPCMFSMQFLTTALYSWFHFETVMFFTNPCLRV